MTNYGSSYGPSRGSGGHDSSHSRYSPYNTNGSGSRYTQSDSNLGGSGYGRYPSSSSSSSSYYGNPMMGGSGSSSGRYHSSGGSSSSHHHRPHSSSSSSLRKPRSEFGISYGQAGASLRSVDWQHADLPPFQKNFYREADSVSSLSEQEINRWRKDHDMTVLGENIPRPVRTFEEAGFPEYIMAEIRRAGFERPTAIQSQGWPMAMSGRDIVGIAKTGSGKTLGFLLPSIVHINAQPLLRPGDGPIVLIIAPTRELAVQIEGEASKFAASSKIKHTCVYGGVPRREQARTLKNGVEIVICTPGRLLDFLESGTTNLRRVTYLVIDEADRLLDMGFEPQLKALMSQVRPDKQILMWSATWPEEVRSLAHEFLRGQILQVAIGSFDTAANTDVTQVIEIMESYDKQGRLFELLREYLEKTSIESPTKILVFTATKRTCDSLTRMLKTDQWPATSIHGDKQQYDRDQALADFKHGRCPIMLATDVASRGIHVDDITVVINFDMPGNIEDYVHRIGRTGRCGKKGIAISFFTRDDAKRAHKLIQILEKANQRIPPELKQITREFGGSNSKGGSRNNRMNSNGYRSSNNGSSSSSSSSYSNKYGGSGSSNSNNSKSSVHGLPPTSSSSHSNGHSSSSNGHHHSSSNHHSSGSSHHQSSSSATNSTSTAAASSAATAAAANNQAAMNAAYSMQPYNAAAYGYPYQYSMQYYAAYGMNPAMNGMASGQMQSAASSNGTQSGASAATAITIASDQKDSN